MSGKTIAVVEGHRASSLLTVNLAKQLLKEQRHSNIQKEKVIKELELEVSHAEKILAPTGFNGNPNTVLQNAGFGNLLSRRQEALEAINRIKLELATEGEFSLNEIKEVAIKYRLRFLPVQLYKGDLDSQLPQKIQDVENKYGGRLHSQYTNIRGVDYAKYYILAPESSFELQERPKDPLVFVCLNKNRFVLVHKWGNDLSWFRKIFMFPYRNEGALALIQLLVALILSYSYYSFGNSDHWLSWVSGIPIMILWIIHWAVWGSNNQLSSWNWNNPFND